MQKMQAKLWICCSKHLKIDMRKFLLAVVALAVSVATFAQNAVVSTPDKSDVAYFCNPPLPYHPHHLNILFIGNSFSIDTSAALPYIFNNMNIQNVNVYVLYKGGCSMKTHYDLFKSGKKDYEFYRYNFEGETKMEKSISISDAMSRFSYDIVIFQQYSLESGQYSTYEPYLSKLIQAYKTVAISPRTTFAWNMTWAYSSKHKRISTYGTPEKMYQSICNATKHMKAASGIDVIIPTGTAVQNARSISSLVTKNEFTRDDQHIDYNMGRYLLGCTFFEAIIAPTMERNLVEDTSIIGKDGTENQVNNTNRHLLKKCARLAVANNYNVSEFISE